MGANSQTFAGRTALVTGSTQGLGAALLHQMADLGLSTAIVTGRGVDRGQKVAAELQTKGCDATYIPVDLASMASVLELVEQVRERYGVVHHLANCAGITDRGDIWDTTPELFERMMQINLHAPFFIIQGVARMARDAGVPASVVNVGSVSGHGGAPFITPYCISKGALMTMTKTLANQLMRDHIRVVGVNPGWMDTPAEDMIQRKYHNAPDNWLELAAATRPFGRLIQPEELARTIAFVLSDEAGMMTGSIIDYDQSVQGTSDN